MYVLDTDTLTLLHAGNPQLERNKARFDPSQIAITIINRIEALRGRFDFVLKAADGAQLRQALTWLRRSEELLADFHILTCNDAVLEVFDTLRPNKKLKKIGRADLLIACIALAHRATLVTRNTKHFQLVPGLTIENWVD
jgi:tRNA(fMet)-specific endonuclease VapC